MGSKSEAERKLCIGIDCLVEDMGELCNSTLKDDILVERRIKDAEFRDELLQHLKRVVECRKLSEMQADTGMGDARYAMYLTVSPKELRVAGPAKICGFR
jgi:hypothetical protein